MSEVKTVPIEYFLMTNPVLQVQPEKLYHYAALDTPPPPIVINKFNQVMDGNHRLVVALVKQEKEIPVVVEEEK